MMAWPKHPIIYEINTWVWLHELSQRYHTAITLGNVPSQEWQAIAALGVHAVWFMGVWERSPAGRRIARAQADLQAEFRRVLPDFRQEDLEGVCVLRPAPHGTVRRGTVRLLSQTVNGHQGPEFSGGRMAAVRAQRMAGQSQFPQCGSLVLARR
jgi:hypothetical protein